MQVNYVSTSENGENYLRAIYSFIQRKLRNDEIRYNEDIILNVDELVGFLHDTPEITKNILLGEGNQTAKKNIYATLKALSTTSNLNNNIGFWELDADNLIPTDAFKDYFYLQFAK